MIKIINLTKSFGPRTILDSISFNVNKGERIGLVGKNGHGKTTILKMITGEEHQDDGDIVVPKGYTIGYVQQHLTFSESTVIEEGCLGLREHEKDQRWKVEKILCGLGFSIEDLQKDPKGFSGGYQVRLNLAKTLVAEPDMLLLDEPTNYLDVVSIRWLASYLKQWPGELILITHDRSFMDSITTHTIGIHRKKVRKISGSTDKLYEQIIKEEEIHEKTRLNDEKKKKEVEQFINRFRAKARLAGLVQSRVKALEKKQSLDKLEKIKTLDFEFNYKLFNAKTLMTVKELSFSYNDDLKIIEDFTINVGSEDRICVIGKNGKGKSTFLKLLAGDITPDKGEISFHGNAEVGYFAQTNTLTLNKNMTVEDEIAASGCEKQLARNIAGAMMFEGDDALKKIEILSGGEKSRVLLGKILAAPSNLLLLDEPTNHLDMESCDALMAAIDSFEGSVIMVTHNEMFLHTLANRFIVFQSDGVSLFEGSYQEFLEKIGWEEEESAAKQACADSDTKGQNINKKDLRKLRSEILTRKSKELKPVEKRLAEVEELIDTKEKELSAKNNELVEASAEGNSAKIQELSKALHQIQTESDNLFAEFEELTDKSESLQEQFDNELAQLES